MEAVCTRGDAPCEMRALSAALHSLHLYCAALAAALICCCAPVDPHWHSMRWRGQDVRGLASVALAVTWSCGAAAACLRPARTVHLVAGVLAPFAWLAAAILHVALWTRRSAAPVLYLAVYWLLVAVCSAAILWQHLSTEASLTHIELYIQSATTVLALVISAVDCVCFYDEVTKKSQVRQKPSTEVNITYRHHDTHFFSKISFFWINGLLRKGYEAPLEHDDLGDLPEQEVSKKYYYKFRTIYKEQENSKIYEGNVSIWRCYTRLVWPNFYLAGIMKLFSDLIGVIPPLGLAIVIQFLEDPAPPLAGSHVTLQEFFTNGYVMLLIITLALISQAFLSQNSTHLVTVEGTRLKTALQAMIYDKCMRLAPWSASEADTEEDSPLLHEEGTTTQAGLLTNLVSQDVYNIMSCVWICHYIWAIPLKVSVILYLLYTKLGISAIIGTLASILFITPMQFYIGKRLSDNSKDISKCTDHRVSKMTEILQGMNVIKLYVWEDLFKEKILNLREVELKLLNKDSIYWSFLTFTTQVSTILVTVITFTVFYFLEDSTALTAVNVFAGLALFNQLTIPLLILPVTVLMVIQAMVSTKRIKDFLELPESSNITEDNFETSEQEKSNKFNDAFVGTTPDDAEIWEEDGNEEADAECEQQNSDEDTLATIDQSQDYIVKLRNTVFSWGMKTDSLLEVDELDIPAGKLIMVVGSSGSGKTSLLAALLGEMFLERGDIIFNGQCSTWYAGQPPWLLEGSVRANIVMDSAWCQRRYARVLRATALRPDLQLLPEGDATYLGSHGAPLSGGQRVRVCVARALYSRARLLALDEPFGALDAPLARHVVARGFVPAARTGRTVLVATNRLELLHYADLIIAMEDGRVAGFGRTAGDGVLGRWGQLAAEARAAAARGGAGPPGGTARERSRLVRALSQARFTRQQSDDTMVGINEATGAHLLTEVPTVAGGSWRRASLRPRPKLSRQLSSPPPSMHNYKWRRDVRRAVSADASNTALRREASVLRRLLRPRAQRTLARWTPRTLRRLISSDSDTPSEENRANGACEETILDSTYTSITSNGVETSTAIAPELLPLDKDEVEQEQRITECTVWREYARACGWWGVTYCVAAVAAQALALAADCWLTYTTAQNAKEPLTQDQMWWRVCVYAMWCAFGAAAMGGAGAASAAAGGSARRALHDRLLHAVLHAPLHHRAVPPSAALLHRFSADVQVIDKKLPTAISRWIQLALLCGAALLVNAVAAPWTLLALVPALLLYLVLQTVYLRSARELQHIDGRSAAGVVSLCAETSAGAGAVRAGRLQPRMRAAFLRRLDHNHNALLLLNAANRWLGLTLDLVGAGTVCVSVCVALCGAGWGGGSGGGGAAAGLAATYALLLPAYLAHVGKGRADLHMQLAALERLLRDAAMPQEDYRDDCPIPSGWQRDGKIDFENLSVQHEPGAPVVLHDINVSVASGEKVAICGRSGSGKSTLLLSCAGGTVLRSGRVLVDGAEASRVPLRALRHRIVLLPQEPVMFSGTLRENLDPLAVHTDEEIWTSLRAVGLYDYVTAQPAGLECAVGRNGWGGSNGWSGGKGARACAARAALHARLAGALLLDEPGAALDAPAERALLAALRTALPNTTIITVAHRVSCVRGYDRAVVLDEGRVAEQGAVTALLSRPASRLARMLAAAAAPHPNHQHT